MKIKMHKTGDIAMNDKDFHMKVCARDNYRCRICFITFPENEVCGHHIKSKGSHPELRLIIDNGICVCTKCHNKIHNGEVILNF